MATQPTPDVSPGPGTQGAWLLLLGAWPPAPASTGDRPGCRAGAVRSGSRITWAGGAVVRESVRQSLQGTARMLSRVCAAAAAILLIAACSADRPAPPAHHAASVRPVSCRLQYQAWERGPARIPARDLANAVKATLAASRSRDARAIRSAMRRLMPDAVALADRPLPHCADPADIGLTFLPRIYTAGDKARTAKDLTSLLRAAAMLKDAQKLQHQLTAEAARITGKN
jgi:hypothetical protein